MGEKIKITPEDVYGGSTRSQPQPNTGANYYQPPSTNAPTFQQNQFVSSQFDPNYISLTRWAGFVGIINIISGIISCITVVGIPSGIILILLGVRLNSFKNEFSLYINTNNEYGLKRALYNLKTYFALQGWLILISIIVSVLIIILVATGVISLGDYLGSIL